MRQELEWISVSCKPEYRGEAIHRVGVANTVFRLLMTLHRQMEFGLCVRARLYSFDLDFFKLLNVMDLV